MEAHQSLGFYWRTMDSREVLKNAMSWSGCRKLIREEGVRVLGEKFLDLPRSCLEVCTEQI